jgi:putative membrane protein
MSTQDGRTASAGASAAASAGGSAAASAGGSAGGGAAAGAGAGVAVGKAGTGRGWVLPVVAVLLAGIAGGILLITVHGRQNAGSVIPVAIVNQDNPVTTGSGDDQKKVAAGRELAASLTRPDPDDATPLSWQIVDSDDAGSGLRDGTYYAVLTIPKDFSAQLTSTAGDKPTQAQLKLVGNDATSVAVTALASLAVDQAANTLGAQATNGFVDNTLSSFTTINKNLTSTAKSAHQLADSSEQLADSSDDLASGSQSLKTGAAQLDTGAAEAASGAAQVSSGARQLAAAAGNLEDGAQEVASGARKLSSSASRIASGEDRVSDQAKTQATRLGQLKTVSGNTHDRAVTMRERAVNLLGECKRLANPPGFCPELRVLAAEALTQQGSTRVIDEGVKLASKRATGISDGSATLAKRGRELSKGAASLASAAGKVSSGAASLDAAAATLASGAAKSASGAASVADGADQNAAGADQLDHGVDQLSSGAHQLAGGADSLAGGLDTFAKSVPSYTDDQRKALDTVVTTPVQVTASAEHQTTLAGSLIPVVLGIALWLGTLMMYLARSAVPTGAAWSQASVGRRLLMGWLPAVLVGFAQAALLLALIFFGGVKVASPVGLSLFCVLGVLSFAAVNQALVALFGGIGRMVSLAFTAVEAAALGGIIPVETAPGFIQLLNGALPLSRFVDGAGQLLLGGSSGDLVGANVVLALWMVLALLATAFATARKRPELAPARLTPPPAVAPNAG